jgi:hypothetical protein
MALTTFSFDADVPAGPAFDKVLDGLVRHALEYVGSGAEAEATATAVVALASAPAPAGGRLRARFERDGDRLTIVLAGPHLPPTPRATAGGPVAVDRVNGEVVYRWVRPAPGS